MSSVEIADGRLALDGVPRVLLCSSLFGFRIPRCSWRDRIRAVKRLGYHCLDVYLPWNFHETAPGVWDFTGQRDVDHLLGLAAEEGLLVLARPGPYICSEWDGGGLPAWLGIEPGLRVRQAEPRYLAQVARWYAAVLPIIARHQVTRGGAVAMVQLENELDFFDCDDPHAYLTALRDMARNNGIEVPLIACAGQCDAERATGGVTGVVPAFNIYPSDESTDIEDQVAYAVAAARRHGAPLIVTETNRLHRTLRRVLGAGATVIGPYLQVSGWNAGLRSTAANNWGDPLAFMTHDYDFGGVIAPDGTERPDAGEARSLAALIDALGPRLAGGTPVGVATGVTVGTSGHPAVPPVALALAGGGELVTVTNLNDHPVNVTMGTAAGAVVVMLPATATRLLVRDMPLHQFGICGAMSAGAELAELTGGDETDAAVRLACHVDGPATVVLDVPGADVRFSDGDLAISSPVAGRWSVSGSRGQVRLRTPERELVVRFLPRPVAVAMSAPPVRAVHRVRRAAAGDGLWRTVVHRPGAAVAMERQGMYQGAARYRTDDDLTGALGLVLGRVGDVVAVRAEGFSPGWFAQPGTDAWLPAAGKTGGGAVVETRIWGHANFDDGRLAGFRLGSMRGMSGALAVTARRSMGDGWLLETAGSGPSVGSDPPPRIGWAGWMSATYPQVIHLRRRVTLPHGADGAALVLQRPGGHHVVRLDGRRAGVLTPLDPVLLLGRIADGAEVDVVSTRAWGEPAGTPYLLTGRILERWTVDACDEPEMVASAADACAEAATVALPLEVDPGAPQWLEVPAAGAALLRVGGDGLALTFVVDGHVHGRLWTGDPPGALLRGGRGDVIVLPPGTRSVTVLVEATGVIPGHLDVVRLGGSIDGAR